jgi:hypothetical protein
MKHCVDIHFFSPPDIIILKSKGKDKTSMSSGRICPTAYPELSSALGGASAVPDFRGIFLRGYGSQSHAQENGSTIGVTSTTHSSGVLGVVQGDAIRNLSGSIKRAENSAAWVGQTTGIFSPQNSPGDGDGAFGYLPSSNASGFTLDASRVTPTAGEIRPVNTAVRYLIRALP